MYFQGVTDSSVAFSHQFAAAASFCETSADSMPLVSINQCCARRIQGHEIRIVGTQVHPEVHVVNREPERLRQFGETPQTSFALSRKRAKAFLEIVVARHHVEDTMYGFVNLSRPWKGLTA